MPKPEELFESSYILIDRNGSPQTVTPQGAIFSAFTPNQIHFWASIYDLDQTVSVKDQKRLCLTPMRVRGLVVESAF